MLGDKISLNKFKRVEITSSIFSNHSNMKTEIDYMKTEKIHKYVEIKQHATENQMGQRKKSKEK